MAEPVRPPRGLALGRLPTVTPTGFRRTAIASLVMSVLIVVTGAAVRLTGSGLGCPDWPSCYQHRLTAQLSYHSAVEFGNRMVTVFFVIVVAVTLLGPRSGTTRTGAIFVALSGGLVGGVIAQAVLGGIVVYTKLNPYLVMVHFLLSMVVVVVAVVTLHRSTHDYRPGSGRDLVARPLRHLARGVGALLVVVLAAGTATTGSGPHAGGSDGQVVAKRLPVSLRDMAELHSSLALLLVGAAVGLAVALHLVPVPERVRRAARGLTVVLFAQGAIGYTQYFTHLPALLVELHVIGATALVVGMTQLLLALTHHPDEPGSMGRQAGGGRSGEDALGKPVTDDPAGATGATSGDRGTEPAGDPDPEDVRPRGAPVPG